MEESSILSKFDSLVESGLVRYDEQQKNVEYIDGELRVGIADLQLSDINAALF